VRIALGFALSLAGFAASLAGFAGPARPLDLIGHVSGLERRAQVTLFAVEEPFNATTFTDSGGEFRFHGLPAGTYTISVLRRSIGATRRTVVVSPALADEKGAVRVTISYSPAEAAGVGGGTVSKNLLSVPARAKAKAADAHHRLEKRDVEGAQRSLKEAVAIAPQFAQAWNALGMIAYQTHDLPAAEQYFRTAIAAEPDAFEPAVNLGGALLSEGRFKESQDWNRRALMARPTDPLANVQAGIAYFALGDYDRAEVALTETLRVDPSHFSNPQLFLADIYLLRGDRAAAAAQLKDYLARHPDAADADRQRERIRQWEKPLAP
jgi:Tfp pilus assembly protein PilF